MKSKGGNIQEKPYLDRKCQICGRKTLRDDGEVIGELITLVKDVEGYPSSFYLGEWCSEDCFYDAVAGYLKDRRLTPEKYSHRGKNCYMFWREKPKGTGESAAILIPLDEEAEKSIYNEKKELLDIFGSTTDSEETINFTIEELDRGEA